MLLVEFAQKYARTNGVCALYKSQLIRTAERIGGNTIDITADKIDDWLDSLVCCEVTKANNRRVALTLWRAAHAAHLAPPVENPSRVKVRRQVPRALRLEEIARLFAAAEALEGEFARWGLGYGAYISALLRVAYDSGLRFGDVIELRIESINRRGCISVVQSKTDRVHRVRLRAKTLDALRPLTRGRNAGLVFQPVSRRWVFRLIRRAFTAADLPGSGRWLRRACASYVDRDHPGMGWKVLGHSRPGLAEQAYIDPGIAGDEPLLPPDVEQSGKTG